MRASGLRTKSREHIFTVKIHGRNPQGDVTLAYWRVYSFNLFNDRWMLMQMAGVKNGREERSEESGIPQSEGRTERPNVNESLDGYTYIPKVFCHLCVCPHLSLIK